jgi:hypothetical protein
MSTWKNALLFAVSGIGLAMGVPATLGAGNLIQNGGFEITTPAKHTSYTTGQLDNYVTADHWTTFGPGSGTSNPPKPTDTGSLNFLFNPPTADTTGAPNIAGHMILWYSTPSPNGGNFVGGDGNVRPGPLHVGPISQEVDGLKPGGLYTLGFFWAAAQQKGFYGDTLQNWKVSVTGVGSSIPDTTISTPTFDLPGAVFRAPSQLPSNVFSGWMHFSFTFTAKHSDEVISFLPVGNKPIPPITLLDGVTLTSVPEPSGILASVLLFGMFGAVYAFKRAKRPVVDG